MWEYDLSGLCSGSDYVAMDQFNHTYNFNICGTSHFQCLPEWRDTYQYGVAVQVCVVAILSFRAKGFRRGHRFRLLWWAAHGTPVSS